MIHYLISHFDFSELINNFVLPLSVQLLLIYFNDFKKNSFYA